MRSVSIWFLLSATLGTAGGQIEGPGEEPQTKVTTAFNDETLIENSNRLQFEGDRHPCGPRGCDEGYVCVKDKSRMAFVHSGGYNEAKCVRASPDGVRACPMPFEHPASGRCTSDCQIDEDCTHDQQMCCNIGCGLRCSNMIPACDNKALPLPLAPNCHLEETASALLVGQECRNFTIYCVENENRTVSRPMPELDPSNTKSECSTNGDCLDGVVCVRGKDKTAHCLQMDESGLAVCPRPIVAKFSRRCDEARRCENDTDCFAEEICCDIGCESPKCARPVEVCDGHPAHSDAPDDCYYKMTMTKRPLFEGSSCAVMNQICPDEGNSTSMYLPPESEPGRSLDTKELGEFCDGDACPDGTVCMEMVKSGSRRAICLRSNQERTKLCPAPLMNTNGILCKSDCQSDKDCSAGGTCCDVGCGFRCSIMKPVCNGRSLRKDISGRICYHEELIPEDAIGDSSCRNVRLICKRPPWRSENSQLALITIQQRRSQLAQSAKVPIVAQQTVDSCIRGGCSENHSVCIDDKISGRVHCVKVDEARAGMCPIVAVPSTSCPANGRIARSECSTDDQCPTGEMCCPTAAAACGRSGCVMPQPACDGEPIRPVSPKCYYERMPKEGDSACHNLRPVCNDP